MAKLTVKSLAVRVAILENFIQMNAGVNTLGVDGYTDFHAYRDLFGPAVEHKKILKTISDKQKDNAKKAQKKAKKQAEKHAKLAKKADKKIAKMTKTKTPEKRGKHLLHTIQNKMHEGESFGNQE